MYLLIHACLLYQFRNMVERFFGTGESLTDGLLFLSR